MSHAQSHAATTSHDTHVHSSVAGRALLWVAIIFASFGTLEIFVSIVVGHAATVFADGTHNLVDAFGLFGAAKLEQVLARTTHPLSVLGRKILTVTIGVIGPLSYGLSLLAWSQGNASPLSARETIILLAIGGTSFWINKRCHSDTSDHNHTGLSAHLLADMVAAVAIVLTTVVVALDLPASAGLTIFIAVTAFNIMAYLTWKELGSTIKSLSADVAKLAASWLSASFTQAETASEPSPPLVPPAMSHDHAQAAHAEHAEPAQLVADPVQPPAASPPIDPFLEVLAQKYRAKPAADIEQAVEVTAAAIRHLTTLLLHDSEVQMGLTGDDQEQPRANSKLTMPAVKTIIGELHTLREALVMHAPCLVMTSKGG